MADVTLTPDEEALLTPFNAAAFDNARVNAGKATRLPCWLVQSAEAREESRQALLNMLRGLMHQPRMTMAEAEKIVARAVPADKVNAWKAAELDCKQGRALGEPHAFFA